MNNQNNYTDKISVILPCLNEAESIANVIAKANEEFSKLNTDYEIIVVDNNGDDNTAEIAKESGAKVIFEKQRGYGNALRAGIEAARGSLIYMTDSDGSCHFNYVPEFYNLIKSGADFVIGNRYLGETQKGALPWLHYYLGTPFLTYFATLLLSSPVGDINCGTRLFKADKIKKLNLVCDGMEFASEMVLKAHFNGLKFSEHKMDQYITTRTKGSNVKPVQDGFRHLGVMLKLLFPKKQIFIAAILIFLSIFSLKSLSFLMRTNLPENTTLLPRVGWSYEVKNAQPFSLISNINDGDIFSKAKFKILDQNRPSLVLIDLGKQQLIQGFDIHQRTLLDIKRFFKIDKFTLLGSKDGVEWKKLVDTRLGVGNYAHSFFFKPDIYQYFSLNIHSTVLNKNTFEIAEVDFYGVDGEQ